MTFGAKFIITICFCALFAAAPAYAAGTEPEPTAEVSAESTEEAMETRDIYDISIRLDNIYFAYAPTWNPDTHTYDSWVSAENSIRVDNRSQSSNPVMITLSFIPLNNTEITAVFYPESDHPLAGDKKGLRECHIEPDWLLVYEIDHGILVLVLVSTGTHSDLL